MSAHGRGKPLRVAPHDYGRWRYGEGASISLCDSCICKLCTGKNCWIKGSLNHCLNCIDHHLMPVIVCDKFERKPYVMFKVRRRFNRQDYIVETLAALHESVSAIKEHLGLTESEDTDDEGRTD